MPLTLTDEQVAEMRAREAAAQRHKQVADMVDAIYNDPQLGIEARALIKKKFPDIPIPDYDLEQKLNARLEAEKREREDEKRKAREAELDGNVKSARQQIKEQYGFTDDAMKRLEDFMVEKNVGDYEVAAQYFASKEPQPSQDSGYQSQFWNHHTQDTFKEIAADPEEWGRKQIHDAVVADARRARQMT